MRFNVPAEGPQSQFGRLRVFFAELPQNGRGTVIIHKGEDGVVQGRPRMGAKVRIAGRVAVTFDFVPFGITFDSAFVQQVGDFVIVGLIIGYEYGFHDIVELMRLPLRHASRWKPCCLTYVFCSGQCFFGFSLLASQGADFQRAVQGRNQQQGDQRRDGQSPSDSNA